MAGHASPFALSPSLALQGDDERAFFMGDRDTRSAVVAPPSSEFLASLPRVNRFTLDVDAIEGRADLAYVRGRWAATFQTPDGPVDDFGKYIEIGRRQPDGSWLMESDIFNSDLPLGGAGTSAGASSTLSEADLAAIAQARHR